MIEIPLLNINFYRGGPPLGPALAKDIQQLCQTRTMEYQLIPGGGWGMETLEIKFFFLSLSSKGGKIIRKT